MVEGVEGREDAVVEVVDGVVVVEEDSRGLWEAWFSETSKGRETLGCSLQLLMALKSIVLDMWLGEEKSYARLGITGVCG